MYNFPLVSIIIRTFNRPEMLIEALRSVALQTYPNAEAVIVNDGGESLKGKLSKIDFKCNYQLIEFDKNMGRCQAANIGIEKSIGAYIGFLDDDDILYPYHLDTLINNITDDDMVIYSDALQANQYPFENAPGYETFNFQLTYSVDHSLKRMLEGNFIPFQCLLFRKSVLTADLLDKDLTVLEDWDLLIRLSVKYKFKHVKTITSEFRLRMDNTNTTGSIPEVWKNTRKLLNVRYRELARSYGLKTIPVK